MKVQGESLKATVHLLGGLFILLLMATGVGEFFSTSLPMALFCFTLFVFL